MADEFLPPVVTKLQGEIADLLGKLAEAKAAIAAFNDDVAKKSEESAKQTGGRSAQSLLDEFKKRLTSGTFGDSGWYDRSQIRQDISGAFEKAGADGSLALLQRFAKALGPEGMQTAVGQQVMEAFQEFGLKGGPAAGEAFTGGFMGFLKSFFSSPVGVGVGVAVGGAVVTELGAMIQGALLAGIGYGVIAAGIVGQLQNPQVKAAVDGLGSYIKASFEEATSPFHDPLIATATELKRNLSPVFDTLKQNFTDLAPYLQPLIDSIGVFFKAASPGWIEAVRAAGPVLQDVARNAQMLGNAFSIFFEQISHNKGAVEGVDMAMRLLGGTIVATGYVLHGLSAGFNGLVQSMDWLEHNVDEKIPVIGQILKGLGVDKYIDGIAHSYDGVGSAAAAAIKGAENVTQALDAQKKAVDALRTSYDAWFSGSMTVDQANLTLYQDLTNLTDTLSKNKGQWDLTTAAGQANQAALLKSIQSAKDLYDAEVKQYGDSPKFRDEYQKNIDKILGQASAAGDDASNIQNLSAQFGQLANAIGNLNKVVDTSHLAAIAPTWGLKSGLASGGVVESGGIVHAAQGLLPPRSPGTLVLAGEPETDGEVMIPRRGITAQRAAALGMAALSPYGLGVGVPGGGGTTVVEHHTHVYLGGQEIAHTVDMIYPGVMAKAGQRRKGFGNSGLGAPFNPAYPTGNTFGST